MGCALPVKILCKDETGKITDTSEYLIEQGLALRNRRFGYFSFIFSHTLVFIFEKTNKIKKIGLCSTVLATELHPQWTYL